MDPVTLAVATSSIVTLASKVLEGTASEAGKSLWKKIRDSLGFEEAPSLETIAQQVAEKLKDDKALTSNVLKELKSQPDTISGKLVGNVDADKVIIISHQKVEGDFNIDMGT